MSIYYNTLIVLLGTTLLGANAGLIGSFTLLRGRALVGDALAHAALPGLCLAFLWLGHRSLPAMLAGALATGLIGIFLMTFLQSMTRTKIDAAMGAVRSIFFGLGIVLISLIQGRTVEGSKAGLDSYILGKTAGMLASDVELFAVVSVASLVSVVLLFKEFKVASFDPDFARVQGWPAAVLDNAQMALAAVTTVMALPAVGAVMVAAMLILPGAAMRFWTDRLSTMLGGAVVLGGLIGALGTLASAQFELLPAGPIIILVGTAMFFVSMLIAPRRGLIARAAARANFRKLRRRQQLLLNLYEAAEAAGDSGRGLSAAQLAERHVWSPAVTQGTIDDARRLGIVAPRSAGGFASSEEIRLTPAGGLEAMRVTRGYRLWESLLETYPDHAGVVVDLDVAAIEDHVPRELLEPLEETLRVQGRLPHWPPSPIGEVPR